MANHTHTWWYKMGPLNNVDILWHDVTCFSKCHPSSSPIDDCFCRFCGPNVVDPSISIMRVVHTSIPHQNLYSSYSLYCTCSGHWMRCIVWRTIVCWTYVLIALCTYRPLYLTRHHESSIPNSARIPCAYQWMNESRGISPFHPPPPSFHWPSGCNHRNSVTLATVAFLTCVRLVSSPLSVSLHVT